MRVISLINLKGGVAKTISAINIAHILATVHDKRVLLIDNDKQGNVSKFFNLHSYKEDSLSQLLTSRVADADDVIKHTKYENLDIIPANMSLLKANQQILLDVTRPQQTRLEKALKDVEDIYDYCVIDNAPDINMSVINALVITDDILIPVKIDKFAFDGLEELLEQIEDVREFNRNINFQGCFVTVYRKNDVNEQGVEWLREISEYPMFETVISATEKVDETTFNGEPIQVHSSRCKAAKNYKSLVEEYLLKCARN